MGFQLDFAPSIVPSGEFQMRNQQTTNTATSPCRIDQQPMHDGNHGNRPLAKCKRHRANQRLCFQGNCQPGPLGPPPRLSFHFGKEIGIIPSAHAWNLVRHRPIAERQPRRNIIGDRDIAHAKTRNIDGI